MLPDYDYAAVDCVNELLFNRTFLGQVDHPLDQSFYENMVNVGFRDYLFYFFKHFLVLIYLHFDFHFILNFALNFLKLRLVSKITLYFKSMILFLKLFILT